MCLYAYACNTCNTYGARWLISLGLVDTEEQHIAMLFPASSMKKLAVRKGKNPNMVRGRRNSKLSLKTVSLVSVIWSL